MVLKTRKLTFSLFILVCGCTVQPQSESTGAGVSEDNQSACANAADVDLWITTGTTTTSPRASYGALCHDTAEIITATGDFDSVPLVFGSYYAWAERTNGQISVVSSLEPLNRLIIATDSSDDPGASNPLTVLPISKNKVYILAFNLSYLLIADPTSTTDALASLNFRSSFAPLDTDEIVRVVDGLVIGKRAYVVVGTYMKDFTPVRSKLFVVDTDTNRLVDLDPSEDSVRPGVVDLAGKNPWRGIAYDAPGQRLLIGAPGNYQALDGGIEAVNLNTLQSDGFLMSEGTLGAELQQFYWQTNTRSVIWYGSTVRLWNPSGGAVFAEDLTTIENGIGGMVGVKDTLYVFAQTGASAGLRRFDLTTCAAEGTCTETTPAAGPWHFGDAAIAQAVSPLSLHLNNSLYLPLVMDPE